AVYFFFSSRRRHTRSKRDWSSDVCSSDLNEWTPWINDVCGRLGVDPALVDVPLVHDLTRNIAHRYDRPMAPVGSYIMGIALGAPLAREPGAAPRGPLADFAAKTDMTLQTLQTG